MLTLSEVADLLISPHAEQLCQGNYTNRRNIRGYYAQVKCGNHWCKVSISRTDKHSERITAEEPESVIPIPSSPLCHIPIASISSALKSSCGEQAEMHTYTNSSAVEGNWAEFYLQGNSYMISVSHVDLPAFASPNELGMMADELLRQQSGRQRRRFS